MSELYIMCGVAFSGKSTIAKRIAEHTGSILIVRDEVWIEEEEKQPLPKDVSSWRLIRKLSTQKVLRELRKGNSVVYDDGNIKLEERQELRDLAHQVDASIEMRTIFVDTPVAETLERARQNRLNQERHDVSDEIIQAVIDQLEPPTLDEKPLVITPETNLDEFLKNL